MRKVKVRKASKVPKFKQLIIGAIIFPKVFARNLQSKRSYSSLSQRGSIRESWCVSVCVCMCVCVCVKQLDSCELGMDRVSTASLR